MCCWSEGPSESRLNTSFISMKKLPSCLPDQHMTSQHLMTHHKQMSSFAFGHLQLRAPDKVDDSLFASRHGKSDAAGQTGDGTDECFLRFGDLCPSEEDSGGLTCPGWRWRSWLCRPSGLIWSPPRSRSCIAAPRHPNQEEQVGLGQWCGQAQSRAPRPTVPSAFCPRWACAGQTLHRWENSQRYLQEKKIHTLNLESSSKTTDFEDFLGGGHRSGVMETHGNFSTDLQLLTHYLTFSSTFHLWTNVITTLP